MTDASTGREQCLEAAARKTFDVVVIGGGIVGAGVARDAQLRGLRALLLEQGDFASGTSSRSSRLLHGGLRYLAQGRIGLVREASREKVLLGRLAPHLCHPLPFVFPVWRGDPWPHWKLAAGVHVYDALCGGRNFGRSSAHGPARTIGKIPGLRSGGLRGSVRYFDALTNDARLVLDTLRSAEAAGAVLLNYAMFRSPEKESAGWRGVLSDELSGRSVEIRARAVVNATGAWADRLAPSSVRLHLTKGVHLVIDRSRLPVDEALVLPEGPRILFVIPWGERVILGTTDTDYQGDPARVRTDSADITYLLGVVNNALPGAHLKPADLISSWAGVRPLLAPTHRAAAAPSDISRRHQISQPEPGWIDVPGGKLTTYRLMAEQTVGLVARCVGVRRTESSTGRSPLPATAWSSVLPPDFTSGTVREICRSEWVVHLDDLLLRRTSWHFYYPDQISRGRNVLEWAAAELGWDAVRRQAEWERYLATAEFCSGAGAQAESRQIDTELRI